LVLGFADRDPFIWLLRLDGERIDGPASPALQSSDEPIANKWEPQKLWACRFAIDLRLQLAVGPAAI